MAGNTAKELAKARTARREAADARYRKRHPGRAREERFLRKAQATLQRDYGHKVNGTPETHRHAASVQQGALARLFMAGSLSADQLAWSAEIRAVHERIAGDVAIGTVSLETRVDQSRHGDGAFFERLGAVRAEVAYSGWRASLKKPGPVLAMIVDDVATRLAERQFGLRNGSARRLLIDALDRWPSWQRDACDRVDEAALTAAHARLH